MNQQRRYIQTYLEFTETSFDDESVFKILPIDVDKEGISFLKPEHKINNMMEVNYYFFVLKKEILDQQPNQLGFTYFNNDIGVKCIMSGGEAEDELEKLLRFNLKRGFDFVDGLFDGFTGIKFMDDSTTLKVDYFENDWLKFEVEEETGKCLVWRIK